MPLSVDTETWSQPVLSTTQTFDTRMEAVSHLRASGFERIQLDDTNSFWRHGPEWVAFLNESIKGVYVTYTKE